MKTYLALAAVVLAGMTSAAAAQTIKQDFSYKAPSGMFGEGTLKWHNYEFMEEDRAKRVGDLPTGSIVGGSSSSSSDQGYSRPGESEGSARRQTSR